MELTNKARVRLIWIIASSILVMTVYLLVVNYYHSINTSKGQVLERLKAITCTASIDFNEKAHQNIVSRYRIKDEIKYNKQDSNYFELHQYLKDLKEVNNLASDIYTLVYDTLSTNFDFIVTSAHNPYYRHSYEKYPSDMLTNLEEGGVLDNYSSENGRWLSAFAPLHNRKGNVVAIIQADEPFDKFISEARTRFIKDAIIAIGLIIPFIWVLIRYTKKVLHQQAQFEHKLIKQHTAIVNQSRIIKNKNQSISEINQEIKRKNERLEDAVNLRTKELFEATEELKTFLYRSSHEIQGPVATILGLSHLGKLDTSRSYSTEIYNATQELKQRIKSITEVYEIKTRALRIYPLDVNRTLSKVFDDAMLERNSDANIYLPLEKVYLKTDQYLFKSMINEILKNAFDYFDDHHGVLKLRITTRLTDSSFILFIEDNGIGINEISIRRAFDLFYRGEESAKGAGLGLYKVKTAANRLEAKVGIKSGVSKGTIFSISFDKEMVSYVKELQSV